MQIPNVNPVGITETPSDYQMQPRTYSPWVRTGAGALILLFTTAVFSTGVVSLARYCLTSHAGWPFPFAP